MNIEIIKEHNVRIDDTVKIIGTGKLILHSGVQIRSFTVIELDGELEIGERSVLGYHNFVQCSGTCKIGAGTLIGPSTILLASSHQITDIPLIEEQILKSTLIIGNNVWISANCTINHGIILNDNCIVAANSFVNKTVERNAIVGGSPAKFIRYR
jgi:acetyltransferase-like isoleucine patch superfamily enzyme